MLKKHILSVALCGLLFAAAPAAATVSADPQQEYTEVSAQGEQTEQEGEWVDSKEVNTVQASEMTRKALTTASEARSLLLQCVSFCQLS